MRFFKIAARSLVSMLVALLVVEAALRVSGKKYTASLYTQDAERGFALRRNARGWATEEGENFVAINSDGMRDREHAVQRPPGTLRIAVLGDSAAEARQVQLEETFISVAEHDLNKCPRFNHNPVEMLNFGVPGYSLGQQYLTLKSKVWRYQPQVIILAMYMGNAIVNSSRMLGISGIPLFQLQNDRLVMDAHSQLPTLDAKWQVFRDRVADLINECRLALMVNEARLAVRSKWIAMVPAKAATVLPVDYLSVWPYLPPAHPAMREAWKVSEKLITEMRNEAARHNAEFWIVTLDMPMQVDPNPKTREDFRQRIGAADLFYPDDRIAALALRENIPFVTMARDLQRYAETHHAFLHGFFNTPQNSGHWNETGNRAAGELLATRLCETGPLFKTE